MSSQTHQEATKTSKHTRTLTEGMKSRRSSQALRSSADVSQASGFLSRVEAWVEGLLETTKTQSKS